MSDPQMRRADELLTELVELVETARAVPMSGSCVVPREHVLDLLDDLREVLPTEMGEARRIVAERDDVLAEAGRQAQDTAAQAETRASDLVRSAQVDAARIVDDAQQENTRLVSTTGVHQSAAEAADALRHDAEVDAARVKAEAEDYAARLRADAAGWAERTLGDVVETLDRASAVAANGRAALAGRHAGEESGAVFDQDDAAG